MTPELEHYLKFFEWLHDQMKALVNELPAEGLNWRPLPGKASDEVTNSLGVLVAHVTGSERYWVGEVAGGRPAQRDRPAEFRTQAADSRDLASRVDSALGLLREVLGELSPGTLAEAVALKNETVTRRWAVVHALEHAAMHVGHMQLTRQLWDARGSARG
jgi:uncharacterized damage-inducible protein DinB